MASRNDPPETLPGIIPTAAHIEAMAGVWMLNGKSVGWLRSLKVWALLKCPNRFLLALFLLCTFTNADAMAQPTDTLWAALEAAGSTGSQLPFWLHSNRFGQLDPSSANGLLIGGGVMHRVLARDLSWEGRVAFAGRLAEASEVIPLEAYVGLQYRSLRLRAGWMPDRLGLQGTDLTSGPITWSGNARPMPRVMLEIPQFTPVPGVGDFLQVRAWIAHGWFEQDRYVTGSLLHQKGAFLRWSWPGAPVFVETGLTHNAIWAGTSSDPEIGDLPSGFRTFLDVFMVRGSHDPQAPAGEQKNAVGNHVGAWDLALGLDLGPWQVLLRKSFLWEDGSGFRLKTPEDGLYGVEFRRLEGTAGLLREVVWESYYTKSQSGTDPMKGFDNYFNNGIYRSGWSYKGRVLGSPFFTFDPSADRVVNNRFIAHVLTVRGGKERVSLTARWGWSRNYGTYDAALDPPQAQNSVLLDGLIQLPHGNRQVSIGVTMAGDLGEWLRDTVGFSLRVELRAPRGLG